MNDIGPRTESCGTLLVRDSSADLSIPTQITCSRLLKYELNQSYAIPSTPNRFSKTSTMIRYGRPRRSYNRDRGFGEAIGPTIPENKVEGPTIITEVKSELKDERGWKTLKRFEIVFVNFTNALSLASMFWWPGIWFHEWLESHNQKRNCRQVIYSQITKDTASTRSALWFVEL